MSENFPIPETRVLAIASHVVYGHVGNSMATFAMQALGCEVASMNTVHFSNHTGYRQFKGRRTPAPELTDLYAGLKQSYLTDFDMLLTGYCASADAVAAIGAIARDLRYRHATIKPGAFFWALDPVMGDQGRLYVAEDIVPAYKGLLRDADLILPNQFEAELLSGVTIASLSALGTAVGSLHKLYGVAHVVVTSVRLGEDAPVLTVVGSTKTTAGEPRLFKIEVPMLPCFFSGTGDMFAALMVVRLREACIEAGTMDVKSWVSADEVSAPELPLAKATQKVLASMQMVLEKTMAARNEETARYGLGPGASIGGMEGELNGDGEGKRKYLAETKAAEVRLVRNTRALLEPEDRYKAEALEV